MKAKNKNLMSLEDLITEGYGAVATSLHDKFEIEFEEVKIGVLIQQARNDARTTR